MDYFQRLHAVERLIAELKAEKQLTDYFQRDGAYLKLMCNDEPTSEDTPDIDSAELDDTQDDTKFAEDDHEA